MPEIKKSYMYPLSDRHTQSSTLRILLVCNIFFRLPYRVMRCAHAAGAEVYVLGNKGSDRFRFSRCHKKLVISSVPFDGSMTQEALDEINRYVLEFGIDMVMPGDPPSTRTVIGLKDSIAVPCFPLPDLEQFDILNNKWSFAQICQELGILYPKSRLFDSKEDLLEAIDNGEVSFPGMAKALSMVGNFGIHRLDAHDARATVEAITYSPILVQDFIPGEDIGASVYCEKGVIRSYIMHQEAHCYYRTFHNDGILEALTLFMRHMGVDGVYNFDMRLADDGRIYYLECNPRFFFKINLSMLAGINFVHVGLPTGTADTAPVAAGTAVPVPSWPLTKRWLKPWRWWHITRHDLAMAAYTVADPLPFLREMVRMEQEPLCDLQVKSGAPDFSLPQVTRRITQASHRTACGWLPRRNASSLHP